MVGLIHNRWKRERGRDPQGALRGPAMGEEIMKISKKNGCMALFPLFVLVSAMPALAQTPDPFLLKIGYEFKEPVMIDNADFFDARASQDGFGEAFADKTITLHPPRDVACADCHTKSPLNSHDFAIDEADPMGSCVGCHGFDKLEKTKWKAEASLPLSDRNDSTFRSARENVRSVPAFDSSAIHPQAKEVKLKVEVSREESEFLPSFFAALLNDQKRTYYELALAHLPAGTEAPEMEVKLEAKTRVDGYDWTKVDAYLGDLDADVLADVPGVSIDSKMEPKKRERKYKLKNAPLADTLTLAWIVEDARLKALPDEKFKSEFKFKNDPAVALVDQGVELFSTKTGQYRKNLFKVNVEVKWEPANPGIGEHKVAVEAASE